MRILEFLFFMIFLGGASSTTENEQYNKAEFEHLCKILRVAEGEPPEIPDELGKFLETRKILEKLLRATKTSLATYQKVIQLKSSDKEDAEFVSYTVKRRIANEKIRHAMEKVKDVYNRMEEELIQAKKERTLARNNLVHAIYGVQVGELPAEKDISDVLKNISRSSISNKDGGHKNAKRVKIYADPPTSPTCGEGGKNGAGFTLINDFYCLCVGKDSNHTACHEKIGGPGKWEQSKKDDTAEEEFNCDCKKDCSKCPCCKGQCDAKKKFYCDKSCKCKENCCKDGKCCCCCKEGCGQCSEGKCCCREKPYGVLEGEWLQLNVTEDGGENKTVEFEKGWPHIRKVCKEAFPENVSTTAESIQEVLHEFNQLLGGNNNSGIDTSNMEAKMESRRLFVLGFLKKIKNGQYGCSGKHKQNNENESGLCVNYWSVSNAGIGIVWQNYMFEAQKHLQEMERHVQKARQLSLMIQKLKESAEESYRKSGHSGMLWSEDYGFKGQTFFNFLIVFVFFS